VLVDALTVSDLDAHWAGEDEEQARRFGWYPRRSSIEHVRTFLLETEQQWRENGPRRTWAIRATVTGALLGGCEARLNGDGSANVSWWIFPEHRGNGFASRAIRLMVRHAVDTLAVTRFVALIEPDNLASRGVARRAGFAELELDTTGDRPMIRHELVCKHSPGGTGE
jgi:RimJ/RimL family protein N-acetyltransferase